MEIRDRLRLSVEDRFIIINLNETNAMLPEGTMAFHIAATLSSFCPQYTIVCDARELSSVTSDVWELVKALSVYKPYILCYEENLPWLEFELNKDITFFPVKKRDLPINYNELNLIPFDPDSKFYLSPKVRNGIADGIDCSPPNEIEWNLILELAPDIVEIFPTREKLIEHWDMSTMPYSIESGGLLGGDEVLGRRLIEKFIIGLGKNSLLSQFVFYVRGDQVTFTPYHSHAIHSVECSEEIILARPAVIAERTNSLLREELIYFEKLLKKDKLKESEIQKFLENHPQIFRALGYTNIYPQVVLERDDQRNLKPDFIIEPVGSEWCDILDIKLPGVNTVVGRNDRKTLSAAIHELAAQLREYGAYFENEKWSKRIKDKYGIQSYRPKLIGVVGSNPSVQNERELRRLMTAYLDLSIITFDKLIEVAKNRLLI